MAVTRVKNKAYVLGGVAFSANGCLDEQSAQTWSFNPMGAAGSRWKQGPDLNVARGYITPAVIGQTIYAIGGDANNAGTLIPSTTVEAWTVGAGAWDDAGVADLPEACDESQAFGFAKGPLAHLVTLAGCGQWPNAIADVLQYDTTANSWSIIGALNAARRNQAGAVIGSAKKPKLFILGGYDATGATVLSSSEIGKAAKVSSPRGGTRSPASAAIRVTTS
jgi:N-acetylneuraminic acid mutarotase